MNKNRKKNLSLQEYINHSNTKKPSEKKHTVIPQEWKKEVTAPVTPTESSQSQVALEGTGIVIHRTLHPRGEAPITSRHRGKTADMLALPRERARKKKKILSNQNTSFHTALTNSQK